MKKTRSFGSTPSYGHLYAVGKRPDPADKLHRPPSPITSIRTARVILAGKRGRIGHRRKVFQRPGSFPVRGKSWRSPTPTDMFIAGRKHFSPKLSPVEAFKKINFHERREAQHGHCKMPFSRLYPCFPWGPAYGSPRRQSTDCRGASA